jgi:endonuclease/exonuclease/phosphatase family metal-dependent hydrolase
MNVDFIRIAQQPVRVTSLREDPASGALTLVVIARGTVDRRQLSELFAASPVLVELPDTPAQLMDVASLDERVVGSGEQAITRFSVELSPATITHGPGISARNSGGVRVLTLNLFGRGGDWTARRSALIDGLRELGPDLVAFQDAIKSDEYDQALDLLGSAYHFAHQSRRAADGSGVSIASRWPLGEAREKNLHVTHRTASFPTGALAAEIQVPAPVGTVLLVNKRTSWQLDFEYERELEAVAVARFIEDLVGQRDVHVVLASDMNADPGAASVRFLTGRQSLRSISVCYRDAWESAHPEEPGHTYTPANPRIPDWDWPFRRIDYIFVRCGEHGGPTLAISACELAFAKPISGVWASDHFGVMADLVIPTWSASFGSS